MFKVKQKIILDNKYNVTHYEEFVDGELIYKEDNVYDYNGNLIKKENNQGLYYIRPDGHIIHQLYMIAKYITVEIGFKN